MIMYEEFIEKLEHDDYDNIDYDVNQDSNKEKTEENKEKEKSNTDTEHDQNQPEVEEKDNAEGNEEAKKTDAMETDGDEEKKKDNEDDLTKVCKLFIKSIPPNVKRKDLVDMCSKFEGFDYLAISDPNPQKKFHRLGWIVFKKGVDIKSAFNQFNNTKINDFVFHLAYHQGLPTRSKTIPEVFNGQERLKFDLDQAKKLSLALDKEVGLDKTDRNGCEALDSKIEAIKENDEFSEVKKIKKQLDLYIEYLRRVHLFCYYNASEAESIEDYERKCPVLHRMIPKTTRKKTGNESGEENMDVKENEHTTDLKDKLCERIDSKINLLINKPQSPEEMEKIGGRNVDNEIDKYSTRNVVKVDEGKYRCKICSKLFKGESFVKKHIRSKHTDLLQPIISESEFFNNYVQDIQKITGVFPVTNNQNLPGMNMGNMNNGGMRMPGPPQMMNQNMNWMMPPMMPPMGLGGIGMMPMNKRNQGYMGNNNNNSNYYRGNNGGRGGLGGKKSLLNRKDEKKYPKDPREIRSYVDLDAPVEGDIVINYD